MQPVWPSAMTPGVAEENNKHHFIVTAVAIKVQWNLSWETTAMRDHPSFRTIAAGRFHITIWNCVSVSPKTTCLKSQYFSGQWDSVFQDRFYCTRGLLCKVPTQCTVTYGSCLSPRSLENQPNDHWMYWWWVITCFASLVFCHSRPVIWHLYHTFVMFIYTCIYRYLFFQDAPC